jgi:hypothetical protein
LIITSLQGRGRAARAASLVALLRRVRSGVEELNQARALGGDRALVSVGVGLGGLDGEGQVAGVARAARGSSSRAAELGLLSAARLLAGQLAFGLRAQSRGLALPGALGLLAERGAVRLRGSASGTADGRAADGLALRAALELAHLLGTTDRAHGLLAVHFTLGALGLFAVHLAFRASAHRVALGRADRVIAKPFALRVALSAGGDAGGDLGGGDEAEEGNEKCGELHDLK